MTVPKDRKSVGLCMARTPHPNGVNWYECRRRADHLIKPGKYSKQHMDSKCSPPMYWDPTDEEIANYQAKLITK